VIDAIRNELAEYILREDYLPPIEPGDLTAQAIGKLLHISPKSVPELMNKHIEAGKVKIVQVRGNGNKAVNAYRLIK
jgi:hypothetical protein